MRHQLNTNDSYKLRSEEAEEIIGKKSGLLEQFGLLTFILLLLAILTGTWFIDYPDVITVHAQLASANAPKQVIAHQSGKIVKLIVDHTQFVHQGEPIAWIESIGNHTEIIELNQCLAKGEISLLDDRSFETSQLFTKIYDNVGELQPEYQIFMTALQQFNDYLTNGYYSTKKKRLEKELAYLQKMKLNIETQRALTENDVQLTLEGFLANDTLYRDRVISKQDYRDMRSKLYNKQLGIPQIQSASLTNINQQNEKEKEIEDLNHAFSVQKTVFYQALKTFKGAVDAWLFKFVLQSPETGIIEFLLPIQQNQYLTTEKIIAIVNPEAKAYYALINLPQKNFGKIGIGQLVKFRFDAYPYQEFGVITGRLSYISRIPSDSGFIGKVQFSNGLTTNYNKMIPFKDGLTSEALIITKKVRLLERFYYGLRKLLSKTA